MTPIEIVFVACIGIAAEARCYELPSPLPGITMAECEAVIPRASQDFLAELAVSGPPGVWLRETRCRAGWGA